MCFYSPPFSLRVAEVRDLRRAGVWNNLSDYVEASSALPSNLRLWYKPIHHEPPGYDPTSYGPWPGPSWILKIRYAPTWKSHLDDTTWHTVTSLVTMGPNPNNLLHLGPLLSRIFALHCGCLSGDKTNSCCAHGIAMVKSVMAPACFRPRKVNESRVTDIYRSVSVRIYYPP